MGHPNQGVGPGIKPKSRPHPLNIHPNQEVGPRYRPNQGVSQGASIQIKVFHCHVVYSQIKVPHRLRHPSKSKSWSSASIQINKLVLGIHSNQIVGPWHLSRSRSWPRGFHLNQCSPSTVASIQIKELAGLYKNLHATDNVTIAVIRLV